MPHATSPSEDEDAQVDETIARLVNADPENPFDLNTLWEPSAKADDAVDYESDDSLADDEEDNTDPAAPSVQRGAADASSPNGLISFLEGGDQELPELTSGSGEHDGDDLDDLFGGGPSSPVDFHVAHDGETGPSAAGAGYEFNVDDLFGDPSGDMSEDTFQPEGVPSLQTRSISKSNGVPPPEPAMSKEEQLQRELFALSSRNAGGASDYPPAPPKNQEELLASLWPKFERNTVLRFMDLLPPKTAHWVGKRPLKPPKPVQPTRVSLEIAVDQEKLFRLPSGSYKSSHDETDQQVIVIPPLTTASDAGEDDPMEIESDYENEPIGGVAWQDLQILCQDWNMHTEDFALANSRTESIEVPSGPPSNDEDDLFRDIDENRHAKVNSLLLHLSN